ncbi:hypothetical protein [Nonomuraea basaltis]|uniref:hypothetical protein n=1 Tax=Nonomuraea basaltis TaxID=2495887 RepID=UPI00148669D2|nr:hypothetical protein [Nonomuraea basaltis]
MTGLFWPFELYVACRWGHTTLLDGWEWPAFCPEEGCDQVGELLRKRRVRAK